MITPLRSMLETYVTIEVYSNHKVAPNFVRPSYKDLWDSSTRHNP